MYIGHAALDPPFCAASGLYPSLTGPNAGPPSSQHQCDPLSLVTTREQGQLRLHRQKVIEDVTQSTQSSSFELKYISMMKQRDGACCLLQMSNQHQLFLTLISRY